MKTALLALLVSLSSLASPPPGPSHETLPAAAPATESGSLYQLQARLEGSDGKVLALDAFRGQPVLISLFYGRCPAACPMLIAQLKRIEKALSPEARAQTHVVLVSLDPQQDTREILAGLTKAHRLDASRWHLVRTDEGKVQELAAVLGVRYRKLASGMINHSTVVTLLDRGGNPVARVDGLNQPLEDIVAATEAVAKQPVKSARR
ncbi:MULTISPECIES: SCO family protein [Myxococcaceae]|uniref:SCO family protein n=1 Tax=Myxococcaceae TaxID=31 RepID=UPI00188E38ED|nr:SCO family protein [Simulacricoccus sp. 17bor-14]